MSRTILNTMLKGLNLLAIKDCYQQISEKCEKENLTFVDYLQELIQIETDKRQQRHVERLLKIAKLPRNKLLDQFDITRIPNLHPGIISNLGKGDFIDNYQNILIFGNPGTGKSHLSIALARNWCMQGRKCMYISAANLIGQLIMAKTDSKLNKAIKSFDKIEVLIIDDISYVPYGKSETDLLFHLLAERYEQRSTVITSNLAFSKWEQIFKDEMTAAAAIDRLVHHSIILELNTESYRISAAKTKQPDLSTNHHDKKISSKINNYKKGVKNVKK